jgi:hypothetical protein
MGVGMFNSVVRHVRRQFLGFIALCVALGGVSYAAVALPKNSVTSRQIKNGAIRHADLAKNSVTSTNVTDGSLLSADFKPGQLPAGPAGPQGPKGDTGATGLQGPKGDQGVPGDPATKLFAAVASNRTLTRGSGAVSVTGNGFGTGYYQVTFNRADLSACVPVATTGSDNLFNIPDTIAATVLTSTTPDQIGIRIADQAGASVDQAFYLAVFC